MTTQTTEGPSAGDQHSRHRRGCPCRRHHADDRKLAQRRPGHLAGKADPGFRSQEPRHQGEVRADGADRIQRGAERQARCRLRRRPHHLPPVRQLARTLQEGQSRRPQRPSRHEELLRRGQVRLDDRRWHGHASACRWLRSSTASSTTRMPSTSSASRSRRRKPNSSPRSTRSRPTAPISRWPWAPRISGKPRPWATRTSARTTGRVKKAALALIKGEQKLTDADWVEPYKVLAKWKHYLGDGFEAQTYPDSQNLFTLGRAAIYPAGSWEIGLFNTQAQFKMGAFPPPVKKAGDACYISDHTDIGVGLNAKSAHAGRSQEVPGLGCLAGIRRHLRQRAAGLLQPELRRR